MIDTKNHRPIKAVIFDMDGTIIATEHIWEEATRKPLHDRGYATLTPEQENILSSFSGCGLDHWACTIKREFDLDASQEQLIKEAVENAEIALAKKLPFIEGFEEFHAVLAEKNIPTGIATNADKTSFARIIDSMEFGKYFGKHLYCVDHVHGRAKPDPALFLHTAKQLGVDPSECLVIEDSIYGFEAARAAGMRCIGIKNIKNRASHDHVLHFVDTYHDAHDLVHKLTLVTLDPTENQASN